LVRPFVGVRLVISVTECDRWGGGGQKNQKKNQKKCGRRLWMAPKVCRILFQNQALLLVGVEQQRPQCKTFFRS